MLDANLMKQIDRMPINDRVALMEYLARSVHRELERKPRRRKGSSLDRLMGILREPGKPAPTDQEVQDMIADYLIEKHS